MDPSAVIDVCGIIGTPSIWKQHAALVWRVGPTYLFEEVLSSEHVESIYGQGTSYIGNYLALSIQGEKFAFLYKNAQHTVEFCGNHFYVFYQKGRQMMGCPELESCPRREFLLP